MAGQGPDGLWEDLAGINIDGLGVWPRAVTPDFFVKHHGGKFPPGILRTVIPAAPGFQTPFAAEIRKQVGIATGAVGLITAAVQAEQIIATGSADVVLLARELLRDPYWPLHAASELKVDYPWPVQYERAWL